ncbi:MAG: NAD(P)-dependent oxidoreductase, partial [Opitutales bacterium]
MSEKPNLLINLPPTFFSHPSLRPEFDALREVADVRERSHNAAGEILEDLKWADGVLMWAWPEFTPELLDEAGKLRYVGQINSSRRTAETCLERDIPLSEVRHAWSPAVAEYAMALVLNGLRRVSDFHAAMRAGSEHWVAMAKFPEDIDMRERELTGAAVGLIGFGGIGRRLGELLGPFHPELRIYDPFVPAETMREYGGAKVELDELLEASEVIVFCAANTQEAKHMIGTERLALIRPGAVVVNVARSMLFDTEALLERLRKDDLTFLVDVFDEEPLPADSEFRKLPNAYCSPHRAGGIVPSVRRSVQFLANDFRAVLNGAARRYPITPEMLNS